jgi:hypothetical protein
MSNFQNDYTLEDQWAAERKVSPRTTARYRAQPNGLPFLIFGGRVYIPNREGDEWIRSRIRRPNRPRGRPRHSVVSGAFAGTAAT